MSKIRLFGTSSGYTEIAPVAASGNNTFTLPNDGTIISKDSNGAVGVTSVVTTTATITTGKVGAAVTISESGIEASGIGITCANINGAQIGGRRNIIINGAMLVAQRSTSSTSTDYQSVDRIQSEHSNADEAPTRAQVDVSSGTSPYTEGFRKAYKMTNGNQTSGAGADDITNIRYKIESQDIANSGWNYTSASSFVTLQFWIKSSVSQNFNMYLRSRDGTNQTYAFDTGTLSADTWTKIIKTIPGNSNIQIDNDTGEGLQINFGPFWGTNRTDDSVTNEVWQTFTSASRMKDNTTTWYTTNDATLELTGLQLEVGAQATPFEHRTSAQNYIECCRYYQEPINYTKGYLPIIAGRGTGSSTVAACLNLVCNMRDEPSTTGSDMSTIYAYGYNSRPASSSGAASVVSNYGHDPQGGNYIYFTQNGYGGNISDDRIWNIGGYGTGSKLVLDAEL